MGQGTIYDYVGRTVDLLSYDTAADEFTPTPVEMTLRLVQPGQSGAATTGIQKLAQRFMLELLTDAGSLIYLPNRGSSFMPELRAGLLRTSADVQDAFLRAELAVRGNLRREQSITDPADEQYVSATLLSSTLAGDRLSLRIRVISAAGSDVVIIYPLRTTSL